MGHVQHMFICLKHVEDDPGEGGPGRRASHSKGASGPRRHEPFRFPQKGVGACSGAADDAGVAGTYPAGEAHPIQAQRGTRDTKAARFAMIVLDPVLYTSDEKLRKGHRARVVVFTN